GFATHEQMVTFTEEPHPLVLSLDQEDPDAVEKKPEVGGINDTALVKKLGKSNKGVVSIFVHGGAMVFVDGQRKRQTPIANLELSVGKHVIELVNQSKGKSEKIDVTIKPGVNPEIRREWGN